ncbi:MULTISPECIES: GNAT family N-acetyltransferase [unclassified Agarivorans]|uniref:GNAT family N-acetyltransferase n=1 Tax=unclassified Agarivorans TaxID=2636026 RepID=UPI0010D4327D|nr:MULTISPECIES: GNAT family N-acetyltransferase [unclassified Agarivorans]MDO6685355.1 GNAT family N-acetyltransferase [Agarivorans sp. 3_MG-2023]MDO6715473.1 GNAT family N-acetyltransferase [Agarivorans sp. 2_MG-2023]MDO6763638.1 GNAT family N-acetyltransferase [Agarivorans sp. 1_MG-2023]GDY26862.1 N-acetyltransferase [Agarivorans sp. Toyoura001]
MQIRPVHIEDAADIARLAKQLGYNPSAQTVLPNIHGILENSTHQAFVYLNEEEQIVGWIHVFIALRLGSLPFAEIGGMVVDQDSQQQGIGRRLVKQCRHWAASHGVGDIRVRCDTTREQANQFYQHIGFKQRKSQRVFVRDL